MRRGFGTNSRGLVSELFGHIGKAILFLIELGIVIFIALFFISYFFDLPFLGGLSALSHSLVDNTPLGIVFKGLQGMGSTILYNPTSFEEQEASTTQSTETKSSIGVKLTEDSTDRTGIMSPNPRSLQEYTLKLGIKNPMKDFVAANSRLFLGNGGNVTNKTGLAFGPEPFTWETGNKIETLQPTSYLSASADSTTPALKVTNDAEASETNIFLEADYSYDFKSAVKPNLPGVKTNGLKMYQAKFIDSSYDFAPGISKLLAEYKVTEKAAGGPVAITRTVVEPYLEAGKKITLVFKISNSDPNAGIFEAIDFHGGPTSDKILLIVPNEFIPSSSNLICSPASTGEPYQTCKIKDLLSNGNLESLKSGACDMYGCRFNDYSSDQGFDPNSRILTDEPGSNELGFTAVFKLSETMDPDKVYNVYLAFLDGAYTYHAAMKKLIAVQP